MARPDSDESATGEERIQLESIARLRSLLHELARRARIVLDSADGIGASELSRRHSVRRLTISLWRKRWREAGLARLHTRWLVVAGLGSTTTLDAEAQIVEGRLHVL